MKDLEKTASDKMNKNLELKIDIMLLVMTTVPNKTTVKEACDVSQAIYDLLTNVAEPKAEPVKKSKFELRDKVRLAHGVFQFGSERIPYCIVVNTDPLVLVSPKGTGKWSGLSEENLMFEGKADLYEFYTAYGRFMHDESCKKDNQ